MANCANCSRELAEGERGFCGDCASRFGAMSPDAPARRGGGIGGVLGAILGTVGGRVVGIGVAIGISALIGVICYSDQSEQIEDQNRAAAGDVIGDAGDRTGKKSVFDIRTGDCIADFGPAGGESSEQETVNLVECSDPRAQVRVLELARVTGANDDYPGDAYIENQAVELCAAETSSFMVPTKESWDAGSRTITCLVDV